jgi:hypothetical protein
LRQAAVEIPEVVVIAFGRTNLRPQNLAAPAISRRVRAELRRRISTGAGLNRDDLGQRFLGRGRTGFEPSRATSAPRQNLAPDPSQKDDELPLVAGAGFDELRKFDEDVRGGNRRGDVAIVPRPRTNRVGLIWFRRLEVNR